MASRLEVGSHTGTSAKGVLCCVGRRLVGLRKPAGSKVDRHVLPTAPAQIKDYGQRTARIPVDRLRGCGLDSS
jgi:hypothetical protein